jgi:hypothetical protein
METLVDFLPNKTRGHLTIAIDALVNAAKRKIYVDKN